MIPQHTNRGRVLNHWKRSLDRISLLLVTVLVGVALLFTVSAYAEDKPGAARQVQQDPPPKTEQEVDPEEPGKGGRKVEEELDPETLNKIDELLQHEREELRRRDKTPVRSTLRTTEGADPKPRTSKPVTVESTAPAPSTPGKPRPRLRQTPHPEHPERTPAPVEEPEQPTAESEPVQIVPDQSDLAPEDRKYSFSIDGTYEDLVEGFSRQTGLGVLGDVPSGRVKFISTEMMNYEEAIARVRMLLFKCKQSDPYWIRYIGGHLEVARVADIYRELERWQMFASVEKFRTASLPDDELALVIYTPKSGSVSDLERVRDFMPDYARIAPFEDRNAMTIYALVSDIEKYLGLVEFFAGSGPSDPRTLTTIKLEYVLPSQAVVKLQTLMELEGGGSAVSGRRRSGKSAAKPGEIPEPPVSLLPDDAQKVLIVRAMQDKIDEINLLLPYIDVDTGVDHDVVLIPVEHADPVVLISKIQTVLSASEGKQITLPRPRSTKGRGRNKSTTPTTVSMGTGIAMFPVAEANAIAVVGSEEDVQQVRDLVAKFDVTNEVGPIRVVLDNADPAEVAMTVLQVSEGGVKGKGKTATSNVRVVAEPNSNAVWVSGPERDVDEIMDIIETLDAQDDPVTLHIARLLHQKPSFVANILKQYEGGPAARIARPARGKGKRRTTPARTATAAKFTPEDETGRLWVLCTATEWEEYLPLIEQLDEEAAGADSVNRIALTHVEPKEAITALTEVLDFLHPGAQSTARCVSFANDVMVLGANEQELIRIEEMLDQIDQPDGMIRRTFEIKYANINEIATAIRALFGAQGTARQAARRPSGKRGKQAAPRARASRSSDVLSIVQVSDSLVVRTTPEKMEQVASLIAEFDVEQKTTEMRVYEFPPGTDFDNVVSTLTSVFRGRRTATAAKGGSKGQRARTTASGPTFIPQPAARKLVVVAPIDLYVEIEELLDVLRYQTDTTIETAFIPVEHADPEEVIQQIDPLLRVKVRWLVQAGELEESVAQGATPTAKAPAGKRRTRTPRRTGSTGGFHLAADSRNSRVVIAAPQIVIDEAAKLVAEFDTPSAADDPVVEMITLKHAAPEDTVRTLKEMMGAPATARRRSGKTPGRSAAAVATSSATPLTITQAPGGSAIVLRGLREDVEQAKEWIALLDTDEAGSQVKVYEVRYADLKNLCELIMQVVDTTPAAGGRQPSRGARRPARSGRGAAEEEESIFDTKKKYVGSEIYIQADLIARTMIVSASQSKLDQIDDLVKQFDTQGGDLDPNVAVLPSMLYELQHKDAFEASFDLEGILGAVWEPQDQLPMVDYLPFDDVLIVKYPDESRFSEIEELIRKYVDKPDPEVTEAGRIALVPPAGIGIKEAAAWFKLNNPDLEIELIEVGTVDEDELGVERVRAPKKNHSPCVVPTALNRISGELLVAVAALETTLGSQPEPDPDAPADDPPEPEEYYEDEPTEDDDEAIAAAVQALTPVAQSRPTSGPPARPVSQRTGRSGGAPEPETAAPSAPRESDAERRPSSDTPRALKGSKVKIYYDEREGRLILEGPGGALDAIKDSVTDLKTELEGGGLSPDIRIYRVRYIDVNTAASLIDEVFNAAQRAAQQQQQQLMRQQQLAARQAAQRQRQQGRQGQQDTRGTPGARSGDQGQQGRTPQQTPQIQMPQIPGGVQIVPNERDRTLIVRANTRDYPKILELLATIDQPQPIENEWRIIQLKKLNAADVEATLKSILGLDERRSTRQPAGTSGQRRTRRSSRSTVSDAGTLPQQLMQQTDVGELGIFKDDITLTSDPVANTIIVNAPLVAVELVEDWVKRLEGHEGDEFETVTLAYADAQTVATTLAQMFGGGKGRGAQASGSAARFFGDQGGNVLFYKAPESMQEQIKTVIAKMEEQNAEQGKPRSIKLEHAKPSSLVEVIQAAYGGGRGGRKGRGASAKLTISAHDESKQLFVIADEELFTEVENLVADLDQPGDIGFDFRIYKMQHADARAVYEVMTKLITDYMRQARGRGGSSEPFSVQVDDKSNSLIVLGSSTVFEFLETNLPFVDVAENAPSPPSILMVPLISANAVEVAQNINRIWNQRNLPHGETPPVAEANRSTNTVIVRGTEEQCSQIRKEFIDPIEEYKPPALLTETITLEFAQPEAVAESINRIYREKQQAYRALGRSANVNPIEFTVVVTPDVNTKQVVIQASAENMKLIKDRITELDKVEVAAGGATSLQIYPVKYADPNAVVNIINQWSRSRSMSAGRQRSQGARDVVTAVAEHATQSVVVNASESNHVIVKDLITSLDSEATDKNIYEHIGLDHANSDEVVNKLNEFFGRKRWGVRRQEQQLIISSNPRANSVLVRGSEEDIEDVREMITALDVEPSMDTERVTKPYPLKFAEPGSMNSVILNMFRWDRRTPVSPSEQVTSAVDWGTRSVIVTASEKNHVVITKMIEQVDVEATTIKAMYTKQLDFANADDLARSLSNLYRGRRRTGRGEQPVQITADAATNSLLILANEEEMAELEKLIVQLDVKPELAKQRQITSFTLTHGNPWYVRDAINSLFRGMSRNPRDQVTAVPEAGSNAVIVSASPENMERVADLIQQMDDSGARQNAVQVISIENAEASGVARALNDIYVRSAPRSKSGEQPIVVSELQGSHAILVKAGEEDMTRIMETVKELDAEDATVGGEIRVVTLTNSSAEEVLSVLETSLAKPGTRRGRGGGELAGDVRLSTLGQSNSLVISGDLEEVQRLETLARQIDAEGKELNEPKLIKIVYANATVIMAALEEMFSDSGRRSSRRGSTSVTPVFALDENQNAIMVKASASDMSAIESAVALMDTPEAGAKDLLRIIPVPMGINVTDLAEKLESSFNESASSRGSRGSSSRRGRGSSSRESISIIADTRTHSLIVAGSATLFDEVEKTVTRLAAAGPPSGGRATRVIRPSNMSADEVRELIEYLKDEGDSTSGSRRSSSRSGGRRR